MYHNMLQSDFYSRFNQLNTILHSFAYSLTQNVEDSRDLYQETAYRAFKNVDKFKNDTNLKAWLMTIMKNIFINNYRRKAKNPTILDDTHDDYYINSGKQNIINQANSNIMMQELVKMIEELEDNLKIPFLMHYRGYKYQEIAEHLDLPIGTIKSRIFLARKMLKHKIKMNYNQVEATF